MTETEKILKQISEKLGNPKDLIKAIDIKIKENEQMKVKLEQLKKGRI